VRKVLTIGVLVLILMTVARPAEALWDFLQEWSGPGPFYGKHAMVMANLRCEDGYATSTATGTGAPWCVFSDYRDLETKPNENFPIAVRVRFLDVGVKSKLRIWKFQQSIEGGVAVGLMLASGDEDAGGKNALRLTVTAPRVVVMPALLLAESFGRGTLGDRAWWKRLLRVPKLHLGGTFIVGRLDAEALGVDPTRSDYRRNNEYVLSRGIVLDFGELLWP